MVYKLYHYKLVLCMVSLYLDLLLSIVLFVYKQLAVVFT